MLICPHCNASIESKDMFCPSCGMAIADMGKAAIGQAFASEVMREEITWSRKMMRQFFAGSVFFLIVAVLFKGCIASPPKPKPETPMIEIQYDELEAVIPEPLYDLENYFEPDLPKD